MKIKVGDTVAVISGKQQDKFTTDKKGNQTRKTGKVIKVYPKLNKVVVEGVNIIKKHQKPNASESEGRIVEIEAAIDASNVMIIDPKTNEPTRVGYGINKDGEKVRIAKKSNTVLDVVSKPKKELDK